MAGLVVGSLNVVSARQAPSEPNLYILRVSCEIGIRKANGNVS
jgi:hypothetical protein